MYTPSTAVTAAIAQVDSDILAVASQAFADGVASVPASPGNDVTAAQEQIDIANAVAAANTALTAAQAQLTALQASKTAEDTVLANALTAAQSLITLLTPAPAAPSA